MSLPCEWKKLLDLDIKSLVGVSKFVKMIVDYFDINSNKPDRIEKCINSNFVLSTKETKCGRKISRPLRYR